ncbi:MAG: hypothetical protein R3D02_00250 [Hyphomicrobiales bacterium]
MADGSGAIPAALPMGAPAGNPNGAQRFDAALSQAQANAAPPPPAPPPPAQGQPEIRGNFLPYVKNPQTGQVQWGVPQVVQGVVDAVTLPGDALAGKVDPNSPEGVARALNFALTVTGGSAAAPKPSGVLTMGIGNGVSVEIAEQVARSIDNLVGSSVPTGRTRVDIAVRPFGRLCCGQCRFRRAGTFKYPADQCIVRRVRPRRDAC